MAIDLDEFQRLRKRARDAQSKRDEAAGALREQMKNLKDEFGVETIEAGEALLVDLTARESEVEATYNKVKAEFDQKWEGKLL